MKAAPLFFLIIISLSWAKEVEVPINIGVGPAFFWIPGVLDKELHPGAKFDLYAVITPKILKENENKIPKQYKKYVNMEEEMHVWPMWMIFIPKYLIISPKEEGYIYGGIWSIIGLSQSFFKNSVTELGAILLPTISYLYTNTGKNDPPTQHLLGIGAMLRLENTIKFSEKFHATLAYGHNLNAPLFQTNVYSEDAEFSGKRWFQAGVLSLVFHFRFINIKQKI